MWRSRNKKGFTLIETVCALSIFATLLATAMTIQLNYLNIKKYNKTMIMSTTFLEALKSNIIGNYSYKELNMLEDNKYYYISKENMNFDNLKNRHFNSLLTNNIPTTTPYIKIKIKSERCIKVTLTLCIEVYNRMEEREMEFLKGDYL